MSSSLSNAELISRAKALVNPKNISRTVEVAAVGSALITESGVVHVGVCIDAACGIGFCAEHAAVASMITTGESRIQTIVAVGKRGSVLSPCGRCRELLWQIHPENADTRVLMPGGTIALLRDLLPSHWKVEGQSP